MKPSITHGESVLFVLTERGRVLCETREWGGVLMQSIPGGRVEQVDRESDGYQEATLKREMEEELGVEPVAFRFIGDVWNGDTWVFYVFVVDEWRGELADVSREDERPLGWVHPRDLVDIHVMVGLSDLIRETL